MKSVWIATAALGALSVVYTWGALGDLVASFPNQPEGHSTYHVGLAADEAYLYSTHYTGDRYVYVMDKTDGSLVSSYSCPLLQLPGSSTLRTAVRGMSYGGGEYIYVSNVGLNLVGRFYRSTGSLISTWQWAVPPSEARQGICCEHDGTAVGNYIWLSSVASDYWRFSTGGSVISSYAWPHGENVDLAWDYDNRLIWYGDYRWHYLTGINTSGSVMASWRVPPEVSNAFGVAYFGEYLYACTCSGTPDEYIWVYHCPAGITVLPASLGRVKALFR